MSYTTFRDQATINKNNLDHRYASHFISNTIIDKLSLSLCKAGFFSKKEYCESIEVVRHIQRIIKSNQNISIYDICGGHGFVGILLALLSKGVDKSYIVDKQQPVAYDRLVLCTEEVAPLISERVTFIQDNYKNIDFKPGSLIIGIHACGVLSDSLMNIGIETNSAVAILTCCYSKLSLPEGMKKFDKNYNLKDLVDIYRITKAINHKYTASVRKIPQKITPMNRLFIFTPKDFYR